MHDDGNNSNDQETVVALESLNGTDNCPRRSAQPEAIYYR